MSRGSLGVISQRVLAATAAGLFAGSAARAQTCGSQWLNGSIPALNGTVYCTIMWDPDGPFGPKPAALVAGGSFTLSGATALSNLAVWDGIAWADLGGGVAGTLHGSTTINALAVMPNGDLVVGGTFDTAGTGPGQIAAPCIARYDGSRWSPMGVGIPQASHHLLGLTLRSNGDLLALGGTFVNDDAASTTAGPLAKRNDNDEHLWTDFGAPVALPLLESVRAVHSLSNGDVVLAGVQGSAPGASAAWRWDHSTQTWQNFGSGVGGTAPFNQALAILELAGGDVVLAGNFNNAGGVPVNSIARWNGTVFMPLGSGISYPSQPFQLAVRSLAQMPNGDIVAGGNFDTAGGGVGGNVARWNGSFWARLPQGAGNVVWSLVRSSHDELIIGGAYTFAGGSFANKYIARYTDTPSPWVALNPLAHALSEGDTLILTAAPATGFANVSCQWTRDGAPIVNGPGGASIGGGTVSGATGILASPTTGAPVTLTISGARSSDRGSYVAVFTNGCGSGSSLPAAISIPSPCPADFNGDTLSTIPISSSSSSATTSLTVPIRRCPRGAPPISTPTALLTTPTSSSSSGHTTNSSAPNRMTPDAPPAIPSPTP